MNSRAALLLLFSFIIMSFVCVCCKKRQPVAEWYEYYEAEHDVRAYVSNSEEALHVVLCLYVSEIDSNCSLRLDHACTAAQFTELRQRLEQRGVEYRSPVAEPDTEGYPDLSPYIPFVLSSDERHEIWRELGLE